MKNAVFALFCIGVLMSNPTSAHEAEDSQISGFGGFFFRSEDPESLAAWYQENFGINPVPTSYEDQPWTQEEGPTVFAPFPADSPMFPEDKSFMLNFRTADLDALTKRLRDKDIDVTVDETVYPNGRFATLADPEGNPIQLWQPAD